MRLNAHQAKVSRSFEFLKDLREVGYSRLQATVESKVNFGEIEPSIFAELIEQDEELNMDIKQSLVVYGHISIALQMGYSDEQVLFDALGTTVTHLYKALLPYIKFVRKIRGDDEVYSQFELLAKKWNSNRSVFTGNEIISKKI